MEIAFVNLLEPEARLTASFHRALVPIEVYISIHLGHKAVQ